MKKILVVVDMQNDFISGVLGTPEAKSIVPKVKEFIDNYDGDIVYTQDTHYENNYLETQEGKNLPIKHCIKYTEGWEICKELEPFKSDDISYKASFGSPDLAERIADYMYDQVDIVGLCTDICVIVNAMTIKTFAKEAVINVHKNLCAGTTIENHEIALKAMSNCQINIVED